MCVIVYKPKGVVLEESVLRQCFTSNNDGGGFAYTTPEGGVIVEKGFFAFKPMYKKLQKLMDLEMVIHFRIMSQGEINVKNCHPFRFQSQSFPQYTWALAHNGTLPWRSTKEQSDTSCFVEDLLSVHLSRDPYFLDSPTGFVFLERLIGDRNKFVIMRHDSEDNETKCYIVNKKAGDDAHGCWFSNLSYRKPVAHATGAMGMYSGGNQSFFGEDYDLDGWHLDAKGNWQPPSFQRQIESTMDRVMSKRHGGLAQFYPPKLGLVAQGNPPQLPVATQEKHTHPDALSGKAYLAWLESEESEDWRGESALDAKAADADSVEGKEAEDSAFMSASAYSLSHLTPLERKEYRRMAYDHCKNTLKSTKGWTPGEMIIWFREEMRSLFPKQTETMVSKQLDVWIVKGGLELARAMASEDAEVGVS